MKFGYFTNHRKLLENLSMALSKCKKEEILTNAKAWFQTSIAKNHILNTEKLINPEEFNINPFLATYLANFLTGNSDKRSIAKALVYPRALGTSITTTFGNHIQRFTNDVLESFGSTTSGIDIEFVDQVDGLKKFCQLKAGPNTINKDDVETIAGHFQGVIALGRTNNQRIHQDQMIVGLIYGEKSEVSSHYKRLFRQYNFPVHEARDFWYRLTGDSDFYDDLTVAIGKVAIEADYKAALESVIDQLAENLP